jgi:hypothetical protein
MSRMNVTPLILSACLAAGTAEAAGCAPGVGPSCLGEVVRSTQSVKFGAVRPALVKTGRPIAAGTRYCLVGQSRIGRKLWFYVSNSELMLDGADLALPTGCSLDTLDTSEPD